LLIAALTLSFIIHKKASFKALGSPEDINKLNDMADSLRMSEDRVKSVTSLLSKYYVRGEEIIISAMKNDHPMAVLKVIGALFLIAQFGNYFSPLTVFWLAGNWLLIWPAIYTHKKDLIDSKYHSVRDTVLKNTDPLLKKLPNNLNVGNVANVDTSASKVTNGSDEKKSQ